MADDIVSAIVKPFQDVLGSIWSQVVNQSIPILLQLVGATILILVGWVIGRLLKQIVIKFFQSTRVDQWIDEQNLASAIGGKEVSTLAGSLVKWYVIVLFIGEAANRLNLGVLKDFFTALATYIPAVLGAIVIFVGGLLLGRYAKNSIEATQHKMKKLAATLTEGIIVLFTGILALSMILEDKMEVLARYLEIFIYPFIVAFAVVTAIVLGIVCLMAFKEDLKKMAIDLKKSLK